MKRKAKCIVVTDGEGGPEENVYSRQGPEDFPIDVDAEGQAPCSSSGFASTAVEYSQVSGACSR